MRMAAVIPRPSGRLIAISSFPQES
jgi:hypothetical protein